MTRNRHIAVSASLATALALGRRCVWADTLVEDIELQCRGAEVHTLDGKITD
jgi:hypothetical protein